MAVQRKVFRIEESAYHLSRNAGPGSVPGAELDALRARMTAQTPVSRDAMDRARAQIAEAQAYKHELGLIHAAIVEARDAMAALGADAPGGPQAGRLSRELAAIVADAERSAETILQAAEDIDRSAAELSAGAQSGRERDLANDIRCHVGQILEACGFHDLTGQRVSKLQSALAHVEAEIARLMKIWSGIEPIGPAVAAKPEAGDRRFLNGPKLDGDSGHYAQVDVDAMFRRA